MSLIPLVAIDGVAAGSTIDLSDANSATTTAADDPIPWSQDVAPGDIAKQQVAAIRADWGVTEAEARLRLSRMPALAKMNAAAQALTHTFAGVWMDHADSGRIKVATTQEMASTRLPVEASIAPVVVEVPVGRSLAALRAMRDEAAGLERATEDLAGYWIDYPTNQVVARVYDPGPGGADRSAAHVDELHQLAARSDGALRVTVGGRPPVPVACTIANCSPPLRGGVTMTTATGVPQCTLGFIAQATNGVLHALTAGHCAAQAYYHAGRLIGSTTFGVDEGGIDGRRILINRPGDWSPQNRVISDTGIPGDPSTYVAVTHVQETLAMAVGDYVCRTGSTGVYCGAIENTEHGSGLILVNRCASPGDSGGPVVSPAFLTAFGLTANAEEGEKFCDSGGDGYFFSPIRNIEQALGVKVLLRPGRTSRPFVRSGPYFLLRETLTSGSFEIGVVFGEAADVPLMCDWDGNGTKTVGVFRRSNATFFFRDSNTAGPATSVPYGEATDTPLCGDWDGDGDETIAIWRNGWFHLRDSNSPGPANAIVQFGNPTDTPVVGDWDGDGDDTIGVSRAEPAGPRGWYLSNANVAPSAVGFLYGNATDLPRSGNWDGDFDDNPGVVRQIDGMWTWYVRNANNAGPHHIQFVYGAAVDAPGVFV